MARPAPSDTIAPAGAVGDRRSPVARIFRNVGKLVTGKAAAGLLSLVYLVIVTRQLGADGYGVLVLINAYAVLIGSLVAFSGFHGVIRYGALAIEQRDRAGLARIVRFSAVIELGCGIAAVLIAAALVPLVGPRLGWSAEATRMALPYSLAVLATVRATPQGLLQLADRFDLVALHQTVSPVVRLAGTLIVWQSGGGITAYLIVWLASALAEGAAMWALAFGAWHTLTGEPLRGPWRATPGENPGFGRFVLANNVDITLRELAPQLVPLTVGWMIGPAAAGLLALAQRATNVLQQPAVLLASGSYAVLADLAAKGHGRRLRKAVWRSTGLTALGSLLVLAALALFGGHLLVWIGGGSFAGGRWLMMLVALARAMTLATTPLGAGLTAMGQAVQSAAIGVFTNLALYPLLPPLLLWLGGEGAGWHAILQSLVATLLLVWRFGRAGKVRA